MLHIVKIRIKSKSKLCHDRRSVGQSASRPVCLGASYPRGTLYQFLSFFFFIQLRVCCCEAHSLARAQVLASTVFLGSEPRGTHDHIFTVLNSRLPQPGGPGSCIYFPQEQGSPVILPGIGFSENAHV
jgi:hypothetical protein